MENYLVCPAPPRVAFILFIYLFFVDNSERYNLNIG